MTKVAQSPQSAQSQPSTQSVAKGDIPIADKPVSWSAAPTPPNAGVRPPTTNWSAKSAAPSLKSNGRGEAARSGAADRPKPEGVR